MNNQGKENMTTFIIEFNETDTELGILSFKGQTITSEILQKMIEFEEVVKKAKAGYFKFFVEEIINGKIINKIRIDIGDGYQINKEIYDYIKK